MVGKQVKHSVSKKKGKLHRFYLIEPKLHVDADKFAEGLIALKPVEEVLLSDGDYGFIVKVRLFDGKEPESVVSYLKEKIAVRYGIVDSYYQYKK